VRTTVILLLILAYPCHIVNAQDLSRIRENELLSLTGNFSIDQKLMPWVNVNGASNLNPYAYFLLGGMNMSFYGFSMPFNFTYSNQNLGYSHPFTFNQFGAQPSYKWVKAYVGYNSISFSPYTLNGHQFSGIGIELTPPSIPISMSLVYGRLLKAVDFVPNRSIPAYKRMGFGLKNTVTFSKANFSTSMFYSWDEENSIALLPDSLGVLPKENLAVSFEGGFNPLKGVNIEFNVGNSVVSDDKFSAISNERKFWGGLFPARESTSSHWAYKAGINYEMSFGLIGLAYERVQPNFQTLGAYYTVNDLENITVNTSVRALDGKLSTSGNFGIQRDNLDNQKLFASRKAVGSLGVSYSINQNLSLNASFSSFNSYTHLRSVFDVINSQSPYENLDTLNFTQINRSTTFNTNYAFGNEGIKHVSSIMFSANESLNKQESVLKDSRNIFLNTGLNHSITLSDIGLTFTLASFYSLNHTALGTNNTLGPVISSTKAFMNGKIRVNVASAYNRTWLNGKVQSTNMNLRLAGTWNLEGGHNINCSGAFHNLKSEHSNGRKDLVFNLMYSYNFSTKYSPPKRSDNNSLDRDE
jgi:hypothetical protein